MKSRANSRQCGPLVALILAMCISTITACAPFTAHPQSCSCLPPRYFEAQFNQMYASGAAGAIALKMIDITPHQFRFYYVFKSPQPPSPMPNLRVTAGAERPSNPQTMALLSATVQVLGQIGAYTVGVVHVTRGQNVAQTISLTIQPLTLAGADLGAPWRLAPMQQLLPQSHAGTTMGGLATTINGAPGGLPEVVWSAKVMPQLVSYVKVILPGQPAANRSYVFLRSDDPVAVTVITKAQYLAIAGSINFTP